MPAATAAPSTTQDFVELNNPTGSPIDLSGKYIVQYRSASGSPAQSHFALTGSVPANGT